MEITDGLLTQVLVRNDIAREANPFLHGIAGKPVFLVVKTAGVILAALILLDINRRHPRAAFWTASAFLLIYCGIVGWNGYLLLNGI